MPLTHVVRTKYPMLGGGGIGVPTWNFDPSAVTFATTVEDVSYRILKKIKLGL